MLGRSASQLVAGMLVLLLPAGCVGDQAQASPAEAIDAPSEVRLSGQGCNVWVPVGREDAAAAAAMLPPGVQHRYGAGPVGVGFYQLLLCDGLRLGNGPAGAGALVAIGTHVEAPDAGNGDYGLWLYSDRPDVRAALSVLGYDVRAASVSESYGGAAGGGLVRLSVQAADDALVVEGAVVPTACAGALPWVTIWSGGPARWQRWETQLAGNACIGAPDAFLVSLQPGGMLAQKAGATRHPASWSHARSDLEMSFRALDT